MKKWMVLLMVVAWAVVIAVGALYAPKLEQVVKAGTATTPSSESAAARELIISEFGAGDVQELVLVFTSSDVPANDPAFRAGAQRVLDELKAVEGVSRVQSYWDHGEPRLAGRDGRSALAVVEATVDASEAQRRVVPAIRAAISRLAPQGVQVHVTGETAIYADLSSEGLKALARSERVVVPVVLVVLAVIFGSLAAALLPLGLGLISVMVSTGVYYFYALRAPVDDSTSAIISMIGMGVGVDYSLFMVTRFREELAAGFERAAALRRTLATSGKSIVFSGATVVVSVASLYVVNNPVIRGMALAMVLVVVVAVLAAVTLLPLLLYALGHRVNALRIPVPGGGKSVGFWHRWALSVMKRPLVYAAVAVIPLVALSWPAAGMKTGMPNLSLLSPTADARLGFEVLRDQFAAGATDPVELVIRVKAGTVTDGQNLPRLFDLAESLKRDAAVADVISHVSLERGWTAAQYRQLYGDGPLTELPQRLEAMASTLSKADPATAAKLKAAAVAARSTLPELVNVTRGANVARFTILPKEGSDSQGTKDLVRRLRDELQDSEFETALVGGGPAELIDYSDQTRAALPKVIALVLGITFVVLMVLLRSILLPLKAIVMNGLSVSAAYGALVLVFEKGYLAGLLGFTPLGYVETPVIMLLFAVLFGLSMDYEVFLLSRIKEEYDRTGLNEEAVATGLEQTAGIITGAAAIMVLVFGAFVATGMVMMKEFGFGLAVAVFLDATLIRVVLAPAFMRLMGDWNWWFPFRRKGNRAVPRNTTA